MADRRPQKRLFSGLAEVCALLALLVLASAALRAGYRHYMHTAYPLAYTAQVERWAAQHGFAPSLVYAVIHTESGFDPAARSSVGATGLMQLMPATFEWAQNREHVSERLPAERLFDPEVNIRYGVLVLSLLRESFPVQDTMLAAYNAGRGRVRDWLGDEALSADGQTLREIPFAETREYVRRVNAAQAIYRGLYGLP